MKNRTLLLAAAFLFAISPMIAATPAMDTDNSKYSGSGYYYGVSADEVYQYMLGYGFHVQTITPIGETSDIYVTTAEKRDFIIHIQDCTILGYEDVNA